MWKVDKVTGRQQVLVVLQRLPLTSRNQQPDCPRENWHGGGPVRDLTATAEEADWAAKIPATGILGWFGQDPCFLQLRLEANR